MSYFHGAHNSRKTVEVVYLGKCDKIKDLFTFNKVNHDLKKLHKNLANTMCKVTEEFNFYFSD